ncbi:MAG TPA: NAD-dependent epimerase/dehydratase family protein [Vicinamibacteria bacterium]|nr:NAD-dependent epimerase/dehydratase family protein [Vicinamibacteria bacterium]
MKSAAQPLRDRSVLVTGGSGFIGSHLARAVLGRGARRAVLLDRREQDPSRCAGEVEFVRFELGRDPLADLVRHLEGIELLFHLAAEKHSQEQPDPERVLRANVLGTQALLLAAVEARVRKVVFTSSVYAYGRMSGAPMDEAEVPRPTTAYGVSKLTGEHLVEQARLAHGLPGVSLRFFFVYGPGQDAGRGYRTVIVRNFERLRRSEPPTVYGDGRQTLDYVYVDDVVEAALLAMERDVSGLTLNVGSGVGTPVGALLDAMIATAGSRASKEYLPPDATAGSSRVARIDRARQALGWAPSTSLDDGLRRTWASLQEACPA